MNTFRSRATGTDGLARFLDSVSKRLDLIAALEGAATGGAAVLGLWIVLIILGARWNAYSMFGVGVAALLAGATVRLFFSRGTRAGKAAVAQLVERRAPECRNIVVTAAELMERPRGDVRPFIADRVARDAIGAIAALQPETMFPAQRASYAFCGASAVLVMLSAFAILRPGSLRELSGATSATATIDNITAVVTPPAYVSTEARTLRNPERIEALAGSRIALTASGNADSVVVETLRGIQRLARSANGTFQGDLLADTDGFIAVQPVGPNGAGNRRLVGLSVTPDNPPRARIILPGRDLFVPDAQRILDIAVEADDDIALASLRLRYTKVSGAGEQFTFTDGEVPINVTATDARNWKATGKWNIATVGLAPGDMVVYRAVAGDNRPNGVASESDTFIVEIAGPGALLAGGFSIDEELDRYAISQQMVILKTERLLARKGSTAAEEFSREALNLAAEQRKVRAEFIFMMGGELADEVELELAGVGDLNEHTHAAIDDEAISGRLAHEGRLDLIRAIRSMSQASASLNGSDLDAALPQEKNALAWLQRAFARTRYILRMLTERERLDLGRRLTGVLSAAARDTRPAARAEEDLRVASLRGALASVAALAGSDAAPAARSSTAADLAQHLLRLDPASTAMQIVATHMSDASVALRQSRAPEARRFLDSAATGLASLIRGQLVASPGARSLFEAQQLDGILVEQLRKSGGRR